MAKELPISLTIPLPTQIPYSWGIEATSGPEGCFIQCRGTIPEREKIKRAAAVLGLSYGGFMRRVLNDTADVILRDLCDDEEEEIIDNDNGTGGEAA